MEWILNGEKYQVSTDEIYSSVFHEALILRPILLVIPRQFFGVEEYLHSEEYIVEEY